jgi:hypothetical protein
MSDNHDWDLDDDGGACPEQMWHCLNGQEVSE